MRIRDWSSDLCSSDLHDRAGLRLDLAGHRHHRAGRSGLDYPAGGPEPVRGAEPAQERQHGRGQDRKSVVEGKSVSVRVDPSGRRVIIKTKYYLSLIFQLRLVQIIIKCYSIQQQ